MHTYVYNYIKEHKHDYIIKCYIYTIKFDTAGIAQIPGEFKYIKIYISNVHMKIHMYAGIHIYICTNMYKYV